MQRARQGLVALNEVAGSSSSRYEEKIERAQAVGVLAHSEQLEAALEAEEITFSEFAHGWTENGTGTMQRIRALPARARQQPPGAPRALALACAASLYGKAGLGGPAYPLLVEALRIAHPVGRSTVLTVIEVCADLIAARDKGETLARLCDAIKETDMWWASAEISR